MIVGQYVLHLYCDTPRERLNDPCEYYVDPRPHACYLAPKFPHEFACDSKRESYAYAREAGWVIGKKQYCPFCVRRRRAERKKHDKLPPHKRKHVTLYRAWFWRLKGLEAVVDKTQTEKHEIIAALEQLDKLWNAMPIDQKRDVDPLWEMPEGMDGNGKEWEELKVLRCPNCGYLLHLAASSDGPPRCVSCMRDVAVNIRIDAGQAMSKATP